MIKQIVSEHYAYVSDDFSLRHCQSVLVLKAFHVKLTWGGQKCYMVNYICLPILYYYIETIVSGLIWFSIKYCLISLERPQISQNLNSRCQERK